MKPEWWMERSRFAALVVSLGFLVPTAVAGPTTGDETARIDNRRSWNLGWEQISRGQFGSASLTFREASQRDDADPSLDHVTGWLDAYEALQSQREELREEEFDLFVRRTEQEIARWNMKPVVDDLLGEITDRWREEEEARAGSKDDPAEADDSKDDDETLWDLMRKRVKGEKEEREDAESVDLRDWRERLRDGIRGGVALVHARTDRARWVDVLDEARYAFLNAADAEEFKDDSWMSGLAARSLEIAAEKRHEEKWMDASGIYYELELIYDLNPEYKKLRKECQTHARLEALYAGDEDWERMVRGADPEIVRQALGRIGTNYVRDADFREVVRSGLESILLLAKTPALRDTFEGLNDEFDREMFISRIESRISQIDREPSLTAKTAIRKYWKRLLDINQSTVHLPVGVLSMEFMEGALAPLDEFSSVIWPQEVNDFRKYTVGRFSGVGIQINMQGGYITVFTPLEGTPAYRAGIRPGDVIIKINGEDATDINIDDAVEQITGPSGSKVTLTVRHTGEDEEVDLTMTREDIELETVKGVERREDGVNWNYLIDGDEGIAYLRVGSFTDKTTADMSEALKKIRDEGARGLILDLRFNPGGLLTAAWEMSDLLLPGNKIIVKTAGENSKDWEKRSSSEHTDLPLIVLVNDRSASASEIVSGAVKDHGRGLIIGERTFGKGSVQNLIALTDNEALLKLTTAHYFLPSGRCLQRDDDSMVWGVEPDLKVTLTPREIRHVLTERRRTDIISNGNDEIAKALNEELDDKAADAQLETALLLMRVRLAGGADWFFPERAVVAADLENENAVISN